MNKKELFEKAWAGYVSTFRFKRLSGESSLGTRKIEELTDSYVVLKDSVSSLRINFDQMYIKEVELNGVTYPVIYVEEYDNHRFIPVEKHENNKNLILLFEEEENFKLYTMFEDIF
ncbi:hypothetical protein [Bacillus sp. AG4(2022)]|uniref:hypothetical protein n=1 Tax=Bacillus sp. AG4(2022) TaxID=2962594 RepID=UPI002880CDDF|nr:hypothetical protein [Bacillus sp. AG4(2022)]MDT0160307.1 hypothetical protein [Bacillus sp. AG4(2022)]